jgi:hypothetical protein
MRLGCGGCLAASIFVICMGAGVGAAGWATARALQRPAVTAEVPTAADSGAAQHKIYEIVTRPRRPGGAPVVLSERELNALLSRQLADELPFSTTVARLIGDDQLEIAGALPLRQLLAEVPGSGLVDRLPGRWSGRRVWLHLYVRARVETVGGRRQLHLDVERFAAGRMPLPRITARLLLEPESLRWLRLRLPDHVEDVTIEPGRAVIRFAS